MNPNLDPAPCSTKTHEAIFPNQLKSGDFILSHTNDTTLEVESISVQNNDVAVLTVEFGIIHLAHSKIILIKKRPRPPIPVGTTWQGKNGSVYVKTEEGIKRIKVSGEVETMTWWNDDNMRRNLYTVHPLVEASGDRADLNGNL